MSDLINRQDAINELYNINPSEDMLFVDAIVDMLENLPEKSKQKWIPITEALPEKKEMVLITNKKGHVRCGQYQGTFNDQNYRWWWIHNTLEEVLAWQPLPEPWENNNE